MASKKKPAAETTPETIAYKGFDKDLACNGGGAAFQYTVGQTYKHDGEVVRCAAGGFHSCEMALDIWNYYPPATSRFGQVAIGGAIDRAKDADTKIASAEITIKAELKLPEVIRAAAAWILEKAKGNIGLGDSGHAAATGYRGHAAATGYRGHAAATGDSGHAAATGYRGHAAATGDSGHAAVKGKGAVAFSPGYRGTARAEADGWIVLASHDDDFTLLQVRAAKVGGPEGIKAGVSYRLTEAGEFEEARE